jgi:hypothetical protein
LKRALFFARAALSSSDSAKNYFAPSRVLPEFLMSVERAGVLYVGKGRNWRKCRSKLFTRPITRREE